MKTSEATAAVKAAGSRRAGAPGPVPARVDAVQGALGDPALIAMLGAVAEHRPDAIRRALRRHPGGFRVVLHLVQLDPISADWVPTGQTTCLDLSADLPLLPYDGETNTAYADVSHCGTQWAALLEKGFAAVDNTWSINRRSTIVERGYSRLDDGWTVWDTAEALAQLTGTRAGVQILRQDTADLAIRYLLAHHCPIVIHTEPSNSAAASTVHGVHPGHAYEITGISAGRVQLRNPWGAQHPTIALATFIQLTGGVIVTIKN